MSERRCAILIALAGGLAGGLVGVGGGILFVPALTIFLGLTQVEGESTSLLMIVIVALVGAYRQNGYGNVDLRDGARHRRPLAARRPDRRRRRQQRLRARPAALLRRPGPVHRRPAGPPRARRPVLKSAARSGPSATSQSVDSLTWEGDLPQLRSPILVCSFRGWNDAAAAASTALAPIADSLDAELIAQVDPEEYFDFQTTRPTITLERGPDPPHRVAGEQPDRGPRPDRRPRPGPARRHRAEPALAHLLGDDRDRRRRARGRDGDHAGRADRRGLPHPAGADHRPRLRARSWSRSSTSSAPTTRGRPGSSASSTTAAARSG